MRKIIGIFTIFIITLFLIGCNKEGNSSKNQEQSEIEVNENGFPKVSGKYSFITKKISFKCSDASSGTIDPLSFNLGVLQNENEIIIIRIDENQNNIPGITIAEENNNTGLIDKNANFNTTRFAIWRFFCNL